MRRRIEALEQALHSAEMKETNTLENERNLKRMITANKQLREDMNREIDRYNLLEQKFRDLLVKYNIVTKENEHNKNLVFKIQTGTQLNKYDNFLDQDKEFSSQKKNRKMALTSQLLDNKEEFSIKKERLQDMTYQGMNELDDDFEDQR